MAEDFTIGILKGDPLWWDEFNKRTKDVYPTDFERDCIHESTMRPIAQKPPRFRIVNPCQDQTKCLGCGKLNYNKDSMCETCFFNPPTGITETDEWMAFLDDYHKGKRVT